MNSYSDKTVVLMTDFGYRDDYVGLMKGVLLSNCPGLNIVDLTHNIPPGNIESAAFIIQKDHNYFPENTTFIAVVDPGVGTQRSILSAKLNNRTFISPDNGILGPLLEETSGKTVNIFKGFRDKINISNTFHGRDIMAPLAVDLIKNGGKNVLFDSTEHWDTSISILPEIVGSEVRGKIMVIDHYGNLITNIEKEMLKKGKLFFKNKEIKEIRTFGYGQENTLNYLIGSKNTIELVVKDGSAKKETKAVIGDSVRWIASR